MSNVPQEIITAVNALLAPYGETYSPAGRSDVQPLGYKSTYGACQYLGVSRTALYRLAKKGILHPVKLNKGASNGKVVYSVAELEAYVASCR